MAFCMGGELRIGLRNVPPRRKIGSFYLGMEGVGALAVVVEEVGVRLGVEALDEEESGDDAESITRNLRSNRHEPSREESRCCLPEERVDQESGTRVSTGGLGCPAAMAAGKISSEISNR
ncbi:hypothetical protein ABZP36_008701 [Zizania latifolia]